MDLMFCYVNFMNDFENDKTVCSLVQMVAESDIRSTEMIEHHFKEIEKLKEIGETTIYEVLHDILSKRKDA